jgi:hypothetical protein
MGPGNYIYAWCLSSSGPLWLREGPGRSQILNFGDQIEKKNFWEGKNYENKKKKKNFWEGKNYENKKN